MASFSSNSVAKLFTKGFGTSMSRSIYAMMATWCKQFSSDCTAVLQGMTGNRLTEIESCYGIEMNVEK
jgi:hypothetical protein